MWEIYPYITLRKHYANLLSNNCNRITIIFAKEAPTLKHITSSLLLLAMLVSLTACRVTNTTGGTSTVGSTGTSAVSGDHTSIPNPVTSFPKIISKDEKSTSMSQISAPSFMPQRKTEILSMMRYTIGTVK